jgi:hypothetical protein
LQKVAPKKLRKSIRKFLKSILLRLRKQLPFTNVYIVKRADLDVQSNAGSTLETLIDLNDTIPKELEVTKIVLPREVSHFAADYIETSEDSDHSPKGITLHVAHNNAWDVSEWIQEWDQPAFPMAGIRKDLVGMLVGPVDVSFLGRYVIDPEGGILLDTKVLCDRDATWAISLYTHPEITKSSPRVKKIYWLAWGFYRELVPKRIFDAYKEYRYRGVAVENFTATKEECMNKPAVLIKLDTITMTIQDKFSFPDGFFPSSPQFMPKRGTSDLEREADQEGYLICTVVSDQKNTVDATDEIWIFDTSQLEQGPKYKLIHPKLDFGITIHCAWMPDIQQSQDSTSDPQDFRRESFDRDYELFLKDLLEESKLKLEANKLKSSASRALVNLRCRLQRQEYKALPKEFYDKLRESYISQGLIDKK